MKSFYTGLECPRCHSIRPETEAFDGCLACFSRSIAVNVSTAYDFGTKDGGEPAKSIFSKLLGPGVWRYKPFLPIKDDVSPITLGEGNTPLLHCKRIGELMGLNNLFLKNETQNPTWSFKDRLCSVGASRASQENVPVITASSTGNHGASAAAYAAAAGIPCVIFTLTEVPQIMKTLMRVYGACVFALQEPLDRWKIMKWCVKNYGWFPLSGYVSPTIGSNCYAVDGYKTIAFELYEQLNGLPDFIVVPSAYSDGLFGIWKGLRDLYELGLSNKKCRMVAAEVGGSLKASLGKQTKELVEVPYKPSIAFSIANELGTWQGYTALKESDGIAETANDPEIIDMQLKLARTEGIYAETSSVSALVAVEKLVKQGTIRKDDEVVVVITSTGLKDPNETAKYLLDIPIIGANPKDLVEAAKKYYGLVI